MATLRRSIVALAAVVAVLNPLDGAEAQRGGGGGRPRPGPRGPAQPPTEEKAPEPPTPPSDGQFGFSPFDVREAVERGQGRAALAYYERSAAEADARGDRAAAGRAYAAVAGTARRLGMFQKTIRAGVRALSLLEDANSPDLVALTTNTYSTVGAAYQVTRALAQARRYYEEGLRFAQAKGRRGEVSMAVGIMASDLAGIARAQGDLATAQARAEEAVQIFEAILANLGQRAPERARENARRQAAKSLLLLARVHIAQNRLDAAETALKNARSYAKLVGLAEVDIEVLGLAADLAYRRSDFTAALDLYREAVAQGTRGGRTQMLIQLHQGVARSSAGLGHFDESLAASERAIALIEEVRNELQDSGLRSGFLEDRQGVYQFAVGTALRLRKTAEAFAFAESSRARAFLDLLGNQTTLSKGKTRALVEEEVRLRTRLAEARALAQEDADSREARRVHDAVEAADRDYRAFLERARRENLEQASLMTVEPVSLSEVQGLLPAGTTLLEYLVREGDVVVWVIDRQRAKTFRLPGGRQALIADVRAFRTAIAEQAPLAQVEARAGQLYARLFETARAEIRGDRLLIVPHDVLHYLPFAALRMPDGKWLVEEYGLATLPSASVLKYLAGKGASAPEQILAVGNPDLGTGLNLRWAEREARLVGQRGGAATVLVRAEASEARTKPLLAGAGLIHFATHGELNEADPLSSGLLLVPGGGEDGRLEVRELFGLDLSARLVVLSACETGLGKLSRGDELIGLQRAFLYAGTPTVVTTLWKVDDRASYELIRVFYERLSSDGVLQGLRRAQLTTMRAFPHPFAWAAFGLTGAPW